jgi:ribosome-associated protein
MGKTTTRKPAATAAKPKTVRKPASKSAALKQDGAVKAPRTRKPKAESEPIKEAAMKAAQYALEKKAENVRVLDLRGITSMTDFFVIATGTSQPQVKAIAENVIKEMRDAEGTPPWRSEGWDSLEWVLIDFVDFVVHVFQPTARQYYNVERLWGDAPAVTIEDTPKKRTKKAAGDGEEAKPKRKTSGVRVISDFKEVR